MHPYLDVEHEDTEMEDTSSQKWNSNNNFNDSGILNC